jgi:DNA-binding NarL/FixJ family response regulator
MNREKGATVVCTDRELLFLAIDRMVEGVFDCRRITVESLTEAIDLGPDSVIIDSETGVPQLMRRTTKALPSVPVVVWQRANAAEASLHALELGASGILHDSSSAADIIACLSTVQEGHVWVPKSVAQASLDFRRYRLSPREWQVMGLVSRGLCNKEIAYSMGITEGTTKVYLSRMFDKLEVSDRYELALLGLRHFTYSPASGPGRPEACAVGTEAVGNDHSFFIYRPPARFAASERVW